MKAGWDVRQIEDVTFIQEGPGIRKYDYEEGGFPMINVRCVQDGYIDMSSARAANTELATGKWKHFQVKEGDILFTISGTIGRCAIVQESDLPLLMNTSVVRFRPTVPELDPRFLYLFLQSDGFQAPLKELSSGTAIRNVGPTHIKTLSIPLPPLEEQQRIVAVLDEAFEGLARARAHAEANLQNARELFENFLGAIFTRNGADWINAPLQEIVESDCSLSYGVVQPGEDVSGGLPIVRPTDLGKRTITLDGLKRIDPTRADGYARTKLKGTEILLCVRGSTGVVAMASKELEGANVTRGIVPVRFDAEKLDQRLGYYQFLSRPVQDQIRAGTYGAALMQINIRDLRKLNFSVPSISQQKALLERLESVANDFDTLIEDYTRKVSDTDDLRQSLLQKAFAGELT